MYSPSISKEELNDLPIRAFEGTIHVVDSIEKVADAVAYLSNTKLLGCDTETRPNFKKGQRNRVALLQLSDSKHCFLFRLNMIGLPKEVAAILQRTDIKKVGAAIRDDITALQKLTPFTQNGFIDIQKMVDDYGIEAKSLKKMSAIVLKIRISKTQQLSNWECPALTPAQQLYAATDAWVSLEVYLKLITDIKP
jgi:ribonuclease D